MVLRHDFEPRILGFLCNWCCYAGADLAGVSRYQYPPNIRVIRVMCSGRIDPKFVFRAFTRGADGVFIGGCWLDECHYVTNGNYHTLDMTRRASNLMVRVGLNPGRLRIEWVSASEGVRFAEVITDFTHRLKELGPVGMAEGKEPAQIKREIEASENFIRRKLLSYVIDPLKCRGCYICHRRCPVGAITGAKNQVHVIDQESCMGCGICLQSCPTQFGAIALIPGEPDPVIPEAAGMMISASESDMGTVA